MTVDKVRLAYAFLADYATTTEGGLVQVVNGGLNTLYRSEFPAPMAVHLVVLANVSGGYSGTGVPLVVTVRSVDGRDIYGRMEATALLSPLPLPEGEVPATSSIAVNLTNVVLPRAGRFIVDVSLGEQRQELEFQVSTEV